MFSSSDALLMLIGITCEALNAFCFTPSDTWNILCSVFNTFTGPSHYLVSSRKTRTKSPGWILYLDEVGNLDLSARNSFCSTVIRSISSFVNLKSAIRSFFLIDFEMGIGNAGIFAKTIHVGTNPFGPSVSLYRFRASFNAFYFSILGKSSIKFLNTRRKGSLDFSPTPM